METELIERISVTTGNHVTVLWSDGSLTIEHVLYQLDPSNPAYDHVHLTLEQRMMMHTALYGPPALSPLQFIDAD